MLAHPAPAVLEILQGLKINSEYLIAAGRVQDREKSLNFFLKTAKE
jgi:hypothetical protein